MEAHRSYERFEQGHQIATGGEQYAGPHHGRTRRWLLGAAGAAASAGVVLLLVGLLV